MFSSRCKLCCWIAVFLAGGSVASAGKPTGTLAAFAQNRSWSDKTGSFQLDASLVEADKTTVKLRRSDGRIVSVPVEKLSDADGAFISTFLTAESAVGGSGAPENPFEAGLMEPASPSSGGAASPSSGGGASLAADIPMRKFSGGGKNPEPINFDPMPWKAGAVKSMAIEPQQNRTVSLPMEKEFFAKLQLVVAGSTPMAYVGIYRQSRKEEENYSRFGRILLKDRKPIPLGESKSPWKIMAVSKDGRKLAMVRVVGFDKGNDLAIFNVTGEGLLADYQFTAGEGSFGELHWVGFLPNNRLATISQKHTLTIWNLDGPRIIKQFKCQKLTADIGGNGELLALPADNLVLFLSGSNYQKVGTIEVDGSGTPSIAFSPDGQRFAAFTPYSLSIYSLASGQLEKTIAVSHDRAGASIQWLGNHVLVGRRLMVDIERGMAVWTYEMADNSYAWGGQLYSVIVDRSGSNFVSAKLPHPAVESALKGADSSALYAVESGSSFSIDAQLSGLTPAEQTEIKNGVAKKLAAFGWRLSSGASTQVALKLSRGKSVSREYAKSNSPFPVPFGFTSGPTTKVSFQPWIHTITINAGGKEVFKLARTIGAAHGLSLKEGESIQQAVLRTVKPSAKFFTDAVIPAKVIKPEFREGFGKSKITAQGIK